MRFADRLQESLDTLPLAQKTVQIVNGDTYKCLVILVSPAFEGIDEAQRQSMVWGHLLKSLTLEDLTQVEFIFTDTPAERALAQT